MTPTTTPPVPCPPPYHHPHHILYTPLFTQIFIHTPLYTHLYRRTHLYRHPYLSQHKPHGGDSGFISLSSSPPSSCVPPSPRCHSHLSESWSSRAVTNILLPIPCNLHLQRGACSPQKLHPACRVTSVSGVVHQITGPLSPLGTSLSFTLTLVAHPRPPVLSFHSFNSPLPFLLHICRLICPLPLPQSPCIELLFIPVAISFHLFTCASYLPSA